MEQYFISDGKKQLGPYTIEDFKSIPISSDTLVWKQGMNKWEKADKFNELAIFINRVPPPIIPKKESFFDFYLNNVKYRNYLIILAVANALIYFLLFDVLCLFMQFMDAAEWNPVFQMWIIIISVIIVYSWYAKHGKKIYDK
jgi:hypothetical protein